jgi:hypothetical protein
MKIGDVEQRHVSFDAKCTQPWHASVKWNLQSAPLPRVRFEHALRVPTHSIDPHVQRVDERIAWEALERCYMKRLEKSDANRQEYTTFAFGTIYVSLVHNMLTAPIVSLY